MASSLEDSEDLDMDLLWLVVDAYKDAAVITREMDIESEAVALSRYGSSPVWQLIGILESFDVLRIDGDCNITASSAKVVLADGHTD